MSLAATVEHHRHGKLAALTLAWLRNGDTYTHDR
jgi:hypothetical protein